MEPVPLNSFTDLNEHVWFGQGAAVRSILNHFLQFGLDYTDDCIKRFLKLNQASDLHQLLRDLLVILDDLPCLEVDYTGKYPWTQHYWRNTAFDILHDLEPWYIAVTIRSYNVALVLNDAGSEVLRARQHLNNSPFRQIYNHLQAFKGSISYRFDSIESIVTSMLPQLYSHYIFITPEPLPLTLEAYQAKVLDCCHWQNL